MVLSLSRKGYGSYIELSEMAADDLLDVIEHNAIVTDFEILEHQNAKSKRPR